MSSPLSGAKQERSTFERVDTSDLVRLRPARWLADLAIDWAWIVLFFVLFDRADRPWLLLPLFGLLIGCRQHAISLLGHDGTHRAALRNRYLNDRLTEWLSGWPLGATLDGGYRDWHFAHHRALGTQDDPELAYRGSASPYSGYVTRGHIIARFLQDLIGMGGPGLWAFLREILPEKRLSYAGPVLFYVAFLLISVYFDAAWVFILWCWSIVAGFWSVFRIRTWFEHVGLENMGRGASHRFEANPIARFLFFPHNTHCHFEHHLYPQVPYSNLPELRRRTLATESKTPADLKTAWEVLEEYGHPEGSLVRAT